MPAYAPPTPAAGRFILSLDCDNRTFHRNSSGASTISARGTSSPSASPLSSFSEQEECLRRDSDDSGQSTWALRQMLGAT